MPLEQSTTTFRSMTPSREPAPVPELVEGRTSKRLTVTVRAFSCTSSPARARSWARLPPILIAETVLGTWEISPVSAAMPSRMRSSVTAASAAASACAVVVPSASSESVDTPRRIVAS